jgi:hypothetical protein
VLAAEVVTVIGATLRVKGRGRNYWATVKVAMAPVFPHAMAIPPPLSVMSTIRS